MKVVLRYPFVNFDVGFVNGISGTMLVLRTLCQFVNHMEVEFLPVHYPTEKEKADAALFAHNVRAEMSDALNVPVTDHTVRITCFPWTCPREVLTPSTSMKMFFSN